ncbi:hypothetical protein AGMMS4952_26390 [Spirochaetia bacterium]|nr:hypothetical protein AGMMS4952_26390 [Spirochaetia bacterium]
MSDTIRNNAAERLGTEKIGKLLLQFSIPAITGMLVNALYNVVDRIFVGRGVDEVALGGLSLVLPLMTITMAFAMLFGVGAANMISMRLGQRRREEAENALNHCFWLLFGMGIILMALGLALLEPILSLLGAQEGSAALDYARSYYRIILFGQVFAMVGFGFSHCTRAQGFPAITMISMFIGAGLNIILDPIFIFILHWGVKGAAWATIISQLAAAIWILAFSFSKKAVIRLRFATFKPSFSIVWQIMAFGSAQFILQFAISAPHCSMIFFSTTGTGPKGYFPSMGGCIRSTPRKTAGNTLLFPARSIPAYEPTCGPGHCFTPRSAGRAGYSVWRIRYVPSQKRCAGGEGQGVSRLYPPQFLQLK